MLSSLVLVSDGKLAVGDTGRERDGTGGGGADRTKRDGLGGTGGGEAVCCRLTAEGVGGMRDSGLGAGETSTTTKAGGGKGPYRRL